MRARLAIASLLCAACLHAEDLGGDFRLEGESLKSSCDSFSFKSLGGCAETLFTDHPLHIAVGSLPPGNGFGAGLAFVAHWTPNERWRINWDMDGVASSNQSWRAGGYMTAVYIPKKKIVVTTGGSGKKSNLRVTEYPVFHLYAQGTSLNKLSYFGEGPTSLESARSFYGMTQSVVGANVVWPVTWEPLSGLNAGLLAEANGRTVDLRSSFGQGSPSIEQIYTPATAPGLLNQPAYAQFGQGIRLRPNYGDYVRSNYLANYQEYVSSTSGYSFQRFTADLSQQFLLYSKTRSFLPLDANGPDDCSADVSDAKHKCPPKITNNLEGSISLRFLLSESFIPNGNIEPFYYQPTLGGSDINGNPALSSFQDYRFRSPNLMLFRASFEHSIYKWPIGVALMVDEGKVANQHSDIDFSNFRHSYSAGLTLRAGGFPMVYLLFSWGGGEGTHTTGSMNTSLLGGGARPSLY